MRIIEQEWGAGAANVRLRGLYRAGALAGFAAAGLFRRNLDAEYTLLASLGWMPGPARAPGSLSGWFDLLQSQPLTGMLYLGFFDLVNLALVGLLFGAVCAALWKSHPRAAWIAGFMTLGGAAAYAITNPAVRMLALSADLARTVDAAQRADVLAQGQALLALHLSNSFGSGAGLYPSYLMVSLAGLLLAAAMLPGSVFPRRTALCGLTANALGLLYYPMLLAAPRFTWLPLSLSAVFLLAWYLLAGARLWALA